MNLLKMFMSYLKHMIHFLWNLYWEGIKKKCKQGVENEDKDGLSIDTAQKKRQASLMCLKPPENTEGCWGL